MTTTITSNLTTQFNITAPNDNWVLSDGVSIKVADGHGIFNSGAHYDSVILVEGDITADATYKSGILSEGLNAILEVSETGTIHAYNGISLYGESTKADNRGIITASNIGMYGNGVNISISNLGSIDANVGIYVEAATYSDVENNGTIEGNFGIIAADSSVNITLGVQSVVDVQDTGILINSTANQSTYILNDGLIKSAGIAIQGGAGSDQIINHGNIQGLIVLGDGADTFDNRGGTIDHAVDGGLGGDYYVFGATPFMIIDGGGYDGIGTEITRSLASYGDIESLELLGSANINGTGNSLENVIRGNSGNNILDGGADGVVDVLVGNKGNDTYVLGAGFDTVIETNGDQGSVPGGIDTITSTITRSLFDYAYIENLKLLGSANINASGNELANVITGNSGNNILHGGGGNDTINGGAGSDAMKGSGDDDKFIVDNAGDVTTEHVDEGTADRVYASVSYQLAAGAEIEILNTSSNGGTAAINLVGNEFAQTIIGNAGANIINGLGGIDTMNGLGGNDKYYVDNAADVVVEAAGGGTDRVLTSVNYSLKSGVEVESLTTNDANATTALKLAGNAFANAIVGNSGDNLLNGAGGADTLTGWVGDDIFMFNTALGGGNIDDITDFTVLDDTIRLDNAIFASIAGTGVLTAAQFVANASGTALDASDRIIYETDTGSLIYDANGSTAGGRYLVATLDAGLAITNADFFII
jgi:hypothetical protein